MDLNVMLQETFAKIQTEGFVEKKMEDALKKALTSTIDDLFGSWGDVNKQIKKAISEQLQVNLNNLGIDAYSVVVNNLIKERIDHIFQNEIADKIKSEVDKMLLTDVPKSIKISEIIEAFKKEIDTDDEDNHGRHFTVIIDKSYSFIRVYIDEEEDKSKYDCKYEITVDEKTGEIKYAEIEGRRWRKDAPMAGLFNFEELLFNWYMKGTTVEFDVEQDDIEDHTYLDDPNEY